MLNLSVEFDYITWITLARAVIIICSFFCFFDPVLSAGVTPAAPIVIWLEYLRTNTPVPGPGPVLVAVHAAREERALRDMLFLILEHTAQVGDRELVNCTFYKFMLALTLT